MLTRLPMVGMSSSERVSALEASRPRPIRLQTFFNARKQLNTPNGYTSTVLTSLGLNQSATLQTRGL